MYLTFGCNGANGSQFGMPMLPLRPTGRSTRVRALFRGRSQNRDGGAGLGLALVTELTEAMDGIVEVASGRGHKQMIHAATSTLVAGGTASRYARCKDSSEQTNG